MGGGPPINVNAAGGSTGDMMNDWGDNTGSQMIMVNGGKIATTVMGGAVGLVLIAGVTVWLISRA